MIRNWLLPLLLTAGLAVGFVGCGKKKTEDAGKTSEKTGSGNGGKTGPGYGRRTGPGNSETPTVGTKVALPTAAKPIDTQYISDDFAGAVVLHPARAMESKLGQGILAEVEKEVGKKKVADLFAELRKQTGVDPRKVEQVVVLIDGGDLLQVPMLLHGRAASEPPPAAFPTSPTPPRPTAPQRKDCDESEDPADDCLLQPQKFPPEKFGPGPRRGGMKQPPIPSVIIRFSEAVDQKAILSSIAAKFASQKKDGGPKFPAKSGSGSAFPDRNGDEKKAFPPAKSQPPKTSEPPKAPQSQGDEAADCLADDPPADPKLPTGTHAGKTYHLAGPLAICFVDEKTLLAGKEALLKKMITAKNVQSPLTQRLATLGDEHDLILALYVQPLAVLLDTLPREGMEPDIRQALDYVGKIKTLAITGSISGGTLVSVVAQMPSETDAKGFAALIRDKGVTALHAQYRKVRNDPRKKTPKDLEWEVKLADQMMDGLSVGNVGNDVIASVARPAELDNLPARIGPFVRQAAARAVQSKRANNLKQIGLALHNYHDTYKQFPAADSNGFPAGQGRKAGLSWRVHLLPYLEQQALYNEFKLDQPWDSPHNKTLISRMPAVFANPEAGLEATAGKTAIHVFVGKNNDTPFGLQAGGASVGARFAQILDGTSNTIAAVEAGPDKAGVWTKPGGLPFDPAKNPYDALGKIPKDGFAALMCDGSVQRIAASRSPDDLKALIQHNDGKYVSPSGEPPNGAGSRGATDARKK